MSAADLLAEQIIMGRPVLVEPIGGGERFLYVKAKEGERLINLRDILAVRPAGYPSTSTVLHTSVGMFVVDMLFDSVLRRLGTFAVIETLDPGDGQTA